MKYNSLTALILINMVIGAGFGIGSTLITRSADDKNFSLSYKNNQQTVVARKSNYPVNQLILNRWSPRAFSGESITQNELMTLLEAARWAPSSYNGQFWRFIYAHRNTPEWKKLFSLLVPFNQSWAHNASALVLIISQNNRNNKPAPTHSFDTGAAWQNLALQATSMGLITHGMGGFDYDQARKELHIPEDYTLEAMVAIGKPGNKKDLPAHLQQKEMPSDRQPLEELVFTGTFGTKLSKR